MADPSTAFLLLDVAGKTCALRREAVREILPLPHLHEAPTTGGVLAGFLNLGGTAIPVLDLASLFGLRERTQIGPHLHLALSADGTLALLVDRVVDLVRMSPDSVRPVDAAQSFNGCVEGEIALGAGLVHALAFERILDAQERGRIDAHARRAAERLAALDAPATP